MKKVNNILIILTILSAYVFMFVDGYYGIDRILLCLVLIPVLLVPKIVKKLFKIKISDGLELVYIVFIILTMLFGSIMGSFSLIHWYDSFTHFLSGMFTFVMGIFFLVWFKEHSDKKILFSCLFAMMFTFMIAVLWECVEFTIDNVMGTDTQKVLTTGVHDTMKDMICAILGSILVMISYIWAYIAKGDNFWKKMVKSAK